MTITRQPHDPELGAALEVLLESMPSATIDMGTVTALREETASPLPAIEPALARLEAAVFMRTSCADMARWPTWKKEVGPLIVIRPGLRG